MIEYSFRRRLWAQQATHSIRIVWVTDAVDWKRAANDAVKRDGWSLVVYTSENTYFYVRGSVSFKHGNVEQRDDGSFLLVQYEPDLTLLDRHGNVTSISLADRIVLEAMLKRVGIVKKNKADAWVKREVVL